MGLAIAVVPGMYASIERTWTTADSIILSLDMRCRLVRAPHGSDRRGDNFEAFIRGPIVLARDENIDPHYDQPIALAHRDGFVEVASVRPTLNSTRLQFDVPVLGGFITMVDYSSVDSWNGRHAMTWLPVVPNRFLCLN